MAVPKQADHLVVAVSDLEKGVEEIADRLGVRPSPGGPHPGRGTRNYLLSFGASTYLEIIGPDKEQDTPARPRPFGIDDLDHLKGSRLVTWAIGESDLEGRVLRAKAAGFDAGQILAMSRQAPSGLIEWRLTFRNKPAANGLVPFLIDWGKTPSPALSSTPGCDLVDLRAEHPEPHEVTKLLAALDVTMPVSQGSQPRLIATIETPNGTIELS